MIFRPVVPAQSSQPKKKLPVGRTKHTKVETRRGSSSLHLSYDPLGTDHQRIVKLDRENEVAPPSKVAPSVGRVRSFFFWKFYPNPICVTSHTGDANRTYGTEALAEGRRSKD